ncbi:hypothetical protein BP422_09755 [Brevibacillus formosus]|uniref:Uncharacterized protein n=1 Tax=Brevibacillus formosus TaxID=54913 RepID=A0A220MG39_9BACL|nr:hypothetical protein [Brevibacillus formosus]ASJ53809.1 hypothetical protein BP422_09755 [Brevibacillus formosus]
MNWPEFLGKRAVGTEEFKRKFSQFTGEPVRDEDIKKRNSTLLFYKNNLGHSDIPSFVYTNVSAIGYNDKGKLMVYIQDKEEDN